MKKEVLTRAEKSEREWSRKEILTVGGILVDAEMRGDSQIPQFEENFHEVIEVYDDSSDDEEPNLIVLEDEDDEDSDDSEDDEG